MATSKPAYRRSLLIPMQAASARLPAPRGDWHETRGKPTRCLSADGSLVLRLARSASGTLLKYLSGLTGRQLDTVFFFPFSPLGILPPSSCVSIQLLMLWAPDPGANFPPTSCDSYLSSPLRREAPVTSFSLRLEGPWAESELEPSAASTGNHPRAIHEAGRSASS